MATYTQEFKQRIESQQQRSITPDELQRLFDAENQKTLESGGLPPVRTLEPEPAKELPKAPAGTLTGFADVITQANELAKQKRTEALKSILGEDIKIGAVAPSTFGALLSSFESASGKAADVISKKVLGEEEATGELGQYLQAQKLGVIPNDMEFFDFLAKKKRADSTPLSSLADTLGVTDRDVSRALAASGKSQADFEKLSEDEQRSFMFGAGSKLEAGRMPKEKMLTIKSNLLEQLQPDKEGKTKSREDLEIMIDDLQLPAADKLELLLYLDEIAPISTSIVEGFKGLF